MQNFDNGAERPAKSYHGLMKAAGVRCFHRSAVILFFDLIFFLFGNIVFARMGLNGWFWLYIFLTLCGAAVALLFFVVAKCLGEAAKLQEESDGTI